MSTEFTFDFLALLALVYSKYLPMLYEHLLHMALTGVNPQHRMARRRARPKILFASSLAEGRALAQQYAKNLIAVCCARLRWGEGERRKTASYSRVATRAASRLGVPLPAHVVMYSNSHTSAGDLEHGAPRGGGRDGRHAARRRLPPVRGVCGP